MNFIQFLAPRWKRSILLMLLTAAWSYILRPPVLGVDGAGEGLQGGLGVWDQEAAEAEQRQGCEAVGGQHQEAGAQGPAGAAQGAQTPEPEINIIQNLEHLWRGERHWVLGGIVVVQSLVSFMPIMISRSSFQVFNLLCRL